MRLLSPILLILAALACMAGGAVPAMAAPPVISDARLGGDASRTRLVMDLDQQVELRAFVLSDPYRVIVDLPEVAFRLPGNAGKEGRGLVSAYRFGNMARGKARIVIDTVEPVAIDKAFALPPLDGQPARLVIDLVKTTREEFARQALAGQDHRWTPAVGGKGDKLSGPPVASERTDLPLIVLDPGHGGVDSGAGSDDGTAEKDLVLQFGLALQSALRATGKVRVAMTRDTDVFIALGDRVKFARERQASLFLSLHADALSDAGEDVRGATVYTLSDTASDRDAAALAERENKADIFAGTEVKVDSSEVTDILLDLMHRETKTFSVHFAKVATDEMRPRIHLNKNPHRFAGFKVLRAPDVPSALLELGFMSNERDVRQLTDPQWRKTATEALARAIIAYFATTRAVPAPKER
jgi:N-acetylmuramoyl-L-alanine amidase